MSSTVHRVPRNPETHQRENGLKSNGSNSISLISSAVNSDECRGLLEKVDRMREILQEEKYLLPHILVVGEQSVSERIS